MAVYWSDEAGRRSGLSHSDLLAVSPLTNEQRVVIAYWPPQSGQRQTKTPTKAAKMLEVKVELQELFTLYRQHAVFTDSPLVPIQAEKTHRGRASIEQVHADLRQGPLAHVRFGSF